MNKGPMVIKRDIIPPRDPDIIAAAKKKGTVINHIFFPVMNLKNTANMIPLTITRTNTLAPPPKAAHRPLTSAHIPVKPPRRYIRAIQKK